MAKLLLLSQLERVISDLDAIGLLLIMKYMPLGQASE